jgi:hypothetical protein
MLEVIRLTTPLVDGGEPGVNDPGDTLKHKVTIKNTGDANATGLTFSDTLKGSTLVANTFNISPIAFNDSFTAVGNTVLKVGATDAGVANIGTGPYSFVVGNLLANDAGSGTVGTGAIAGDTKPGFQIDAVSNGITAGGGKFSIFSDGSFNYVSQAGDANNLPAAGDLYPKDSFTYTIRDAGQDGTYNTADDLTSTATVTIELRGEVWYLDGSKAAGTGTGTSADPFGSMASLNNASDPDGANDYIYVKGPISGSLTLEAGQQLIGTGEALVVNGVTLAAAGAGNSVINNDSPTAGITLATDNAIKGITIYSAAAGGVAIRDGGGTVGTLVIDKVAIAGAGQIIDIDQGGTLNVTLTSASSTGSTGGNGGVIDLTGVGGTFTVSGATTINGTHGQTGIDLTTNTSLTANFNGLTTVNMTAAGSTTNAAIILGSGTNAAVNFTGGLDIDTVNGGGLSVTGTAISVSGSNNTINTSGGAILTITNSTVGAGNINFATLAASSTTAGTSININNLDGGTFHVDTASVAGSNTDGIFIGGGSTTTFDFDSATVGVTSGVGISISGAGNGTVNFDTVAINGGANSSSHGVSIQGATSSVTIGGGSIGATDDPAGDGVNISGGTGIITIGASITKTSAGNVVEINDHETGAVTFSGALTGGSAASPASNGILVNSVNSGTVNFNGQTTLFTGGNAAVTLTGNTGGTINFAAGGTGLDITTTTGAGFTATGGGTVNVTGAGNTITSVGGTALNVVNTTIGGSDLTFKSISANGGVSGIVLNNTGSLGGLTVTGDTNLTVKDGTNSSGGVIQNSTGVGISLTSTFDASFTNVHVLNTQRSGIGGTEVNNFTFQNGKISGSGLARTTAAQSDGNISFNDTATFTQNNVRGTVNISENVLNNSYGHGVVIQNYSGTISNLTISDNSMTSSTSSADSVGTAILVASYGTATTSSSVTKATVDGNVIRNFPGNAGIFFAGGNSNAGGPGGTMGVAGSATDIIKITNNNVQGQSAAAPLGTQAISASIQGGNSGSRSQGNFDISGNTLKNTVGHTLNASTFGYATASFNISNNQIESNNSLSSAAITGGIGQTNAAIMNQTPLMTATISGNTITKTNGSSIFFVATDTHGTLNLHILNNNVSQITGSGINYGVRLLSGDTTPGQDNTLNLEISGNTLVGTEDPGFTPTGIGLRKQGTDPNINSFSIEGYVGDGSAASVAAYVNSKNPNGGGTASISAQSGYTGISDVPLMAASAPPQGSSEASQDDERAPEEKFVDTPKVDAGGSGNSAGGSSQTGSQDGGAPVPAGNAAGTPSAPSAPAQPIVVDDGVLSQAELDFIVEAAIARWAAAGATAEQIAAMRAVQFSVEDLAGLQVGASGAGTIKLDVNAAGWNWFIDETPNDDLEFTGSGTQLSAADQKGASGTRIDLLTVVMHELGHQIGLADQYGAEDRDELMAGIINAGERRLPGADDAPAAGDAPVTGALAIAPMTLGTLPAGQTVTIEWQSTVDGGEDGLVQGLSGTSTADSNETAAMTSNTESASVDSLTLGNLVFNDKNRNGTLDSGELGIANVKLTLFADTNNNGVYDEGVDQAVSFIDGNGNGTYEQSTDTPVAAGTAGAITLTVTTDSNGLYSFGNLKPGDYIVRLDASNFLTGGALNGRFNSAGEDDPDNNVNGDDNGVRATGFVVSKAITLGYNGETVADGTGQLDINDTVDFGFYRPNETPTSTNLQGNLATFTEGGAAVKIDVDGNATIADADSPDGNFGGGQLLVWINGNKVAGEDELGIGTSATVTVSGSTVSISGVAIATFTGGGAGGGDLVFSFNSDATTARVQALVQALQYNNTNTVAPSTTQRVITLELKDGDGVVDGGRDTMIVSTRVDVVAVNDAPSGANNAKSINAGATYTFAAADFGFSDTDGNAFAGVEITTLATDGKLFLNGVAVTALQFIAAADIAANKLTFVPDAGESGAPYASFTFKVRDNGATGGSNVNQDPNADTFSFTVVSPNSAPVNAVPAAQSGTEDTNLVFSSAKGNAITVGDAEGGTLTVALGVASGKLTLGTTSGVTVSGNGTASVSVSGTVAAINTALDGLTYRGNLNYSGSDTVTVTTTDSGALSDTDTVSITLAADGKISGDSNDNSFAGGIGNDFFSFEQGGDDTGTGLGGNDLFYYGGALTAADKNYGGEGSDSVGLQGDYSSGLVLGADTLVSIEALSFQSGSVTRWGDTAGNSYSYNITSIDANVAAGQQLIVNGQSLLAGERMTFNGSAETDGKFVIYGGRGNDTLIGGSGADLIHGAGGRDNMTGGAGADTFQFRSTGESTLNDPDFIFDFTSGSDIIDLNIIDANTTSAGNQAFTFINGSAFSNVAGQLRVTDSGQGYWNVEGDVNGDGIADFQIQVTTVGSAPLVLSDFYL